MGFNNRFNHKLYLNLELNAIKLLSDVHTTGLESQNFGDELPELKNYVELLYTLQR